MKTYMVNAVLTADRQIAIPIVVIHCYMSGSRENTGIVFAAEESSPAVYSEMMFFCPKVTESENSFLLTSLTAGLNCHFQSIKIVWCPFTPFHRLFTQFNGICQSDCSVSIHYLFGISFMFHGRTNSILPAHC